ncbi:MAG: PIG-L deacetylase family protein [Acidimicrobiia bacterium]
MRALAIGAHPDDVEFGCGATLAKWAVAGTRCEILVLTTARRARGTPVPTRWRSSRLARTSSAPRRSASMPCNLRFDPNPAGDDMVRQHEAFALRVTDRLVDVPGGRSTRGEPFKLLSEL